MELSLSAPSSWSLLSGAQSDLRQYKLGELSSDSKYGVQHRAIKLLSSFIIPAMHLRITYPATAASSLRFVKAIHIYFNAHPAADLSALPLPFSLTHNAKDKRSAHWTLAKSVSLSPTQKDAKISFALPLHCSFLLIHYAAFHASDVKEVELLKCPRCHIDVHRGVCPQCRENAYQCRQCRNINYDNLTGFLCNECGHSKYGAFSWSLLAAPGFGVDRVKGEEDCKSRTADLEEIGFQLEEMRRESEKTTQDLDRMLRRCERGLSAKVRPDEVSSVTTECLDGLRSSPLSSLFTFGQPSSSSSIAFASSGPSTSSLSSAPAHPTAAAPFTSPLDVFLLSKQKKAHSDLSKTFRVFLNTKREIARYLSPHSLQIDPSSQPLASSPPTTPCFLCGKAALGMLLRLLTELPAACVRQWVKAGRVDDGMHHVLALERVMVEGQHWADESSRQSVAYLLSLLCGDRDMEAVSLPYLRDHVEPLLLDHVRLPSPAAVPVLSYVPRFLQLLFLSQTHCGEEPSEAMLLVLNISVRVLLEAVQHFDRVDVAKLVLAPLLHILLQAVRMPSLTDSTVSASSSSPSSRAPASRYAGVVHPSSSPPFPSEMKSPFFAGLSREGLANIVMSPALNPTAPPPSSSPAQAPLTGRSRTGSAGASSRRLRSPGTKAIAWSGSTGWKSGSQRSPLSSPRPPSLIQPSGGVSEVPTLLASAPDAPTPPSAAEVSPSLSPLQLPSSSMSLEKPFTSARLSRVFARMAALLSSASASTVRPSAATLTSAFSVYPVWKTAVLSEEPAIRELRLARRAVARWRAKCANAAVGHRALRRLLFNPVSSEVRDVTARLLFFLSACPPEGTAAPNAPAAEQQKAMDIDAGSDKKEQTLAGASESAASALPAARSYALLASFVSILSTLSASESLQSSHFFAVFAEFLNASPSAAENAGRKRYCVARGIIAVVMKRMLLELAALQEREAFSGSTLLSHATEHAPEVGEDPSFCLYGLSSLLVDLLSVDEVKRAFLRRRQHSSAILSCYLSMRGIVFARTRLTELTSTQLHSLVTLLFNAGDKRSAIRAYLLALTDSQPSSSPSSSSSSSTLSQPHTPARSLVYIIKRRQLAIMQQLLDIIHPPLPSKQYQLLLRKSPTQEEYIRGNMRRSPYSTSDFPGPLFRHIQDVICADLKLTNEENMFELLVGGKIISMDLEITKVYEKVWKAQVEQQHAQQQHQQQQHAAAPGSSAVDARERERDRERERERMREREREQMRARERLLASISDASLSQLHPDLMSDSDLSEEDDPMLDPVSPHPPAPATLPPMTVIFRLTGLDGEATEPLVESLPDDSAEKVDVEEEFKECDVLRQPIGGEGRSGLAILIGRLEEIRDLTHDVEYKLVQELLKVLSFACQLQGNRRHVLQMTAAQGSGAWSPAEDGVGHYAIRVLVQQLILSLSAVQSTSAASAAASSTVDETSAKTAMDLSLSIIALIQALITEEQKSSEPTSPTSTSSSSADPSSQSLSADASASSSPPQEQFQALLTSLSSPAVRAHPPLTSSLISILPSITFGSASLLQLLYSHFLPHLLALPGSELPSDADSRWWVTAFASLSEHIPKASAVGYAIRHFFFERGLVQRLFDYIQQHRPAATPTGSPKEEKAERPHADTSASLSDFIELPSLPYVLRLLHGLVYGHVPSQDFCAPLIPLLQQLESIASAKKIGSLSELLLASLSADNSNTLLLLTSLRSSTRAEKQKKAAERRQKLLVQLGFSGGDGDGGKLVSGVRLRGMEDVGEEEDGSLRCCVCGDGYGFKPAQMLGLYVFVKPIHISLSMDAALLQGLVGDCDEDEVGVSSVTHFTVIHFRCHQEAVKADKKLKPPKSEWEGAKIRNAHTLCNALFPILLPPSQQDPDGELAYDGYTQAVELYWQRFSFSPRLSLPRYLLVLEDLKYLLLRYANEESFSEDSKGGGKESNVGLIVYLMQMAIFCLNRTQLGDQGLDQIERIQKRAWRTLRDGRKKDRHHPTADGSDADRKSDGPDDGEKKQLEQKTAEQQPADAEQDDDEAASVTRSGKRRRRKKASPPSKSRARKKAKKASYALSAEEQRILDSYRPSSSSAALSSDDDADGAWEGATIDYWLSSMVASLALNAFDEWRDIRWACLRRLLTLVAQDTPQLAQRREAEEAPASADGAEREREREREREYLFVNRLVASRPILLFFLLVNHIHTLLHSPPFPHPAPSGPPPFVHWRSPSSSPALPLLLADRWQFLQRHDSALIKAMQGAMISELMRHGSARHDRDSMVEAVAELHSLCVLGGVEEDVKADYEDVERMMSALFSLDAPDSADRMAD